MLKVYKRVIALLVCIVLFISTIYTTFAVTKSEDPAIFAQTFESITNISSVCSSGGGNGTATLVNGLFDGKSLKLNIASWEYLNINLETLNDTVVANSKALVIEVQMPSNSSVANLGFLLTEENVDNFKPIETDNKTAKVYLVDATNNSYNEVTVTKDNRMNFVPAGFKGWVVINIDDYFEYNWGSGNGIVEPEKISQITIAASGQNIEYYFDNIGFAASQESFIEKLGATENQDVPENQESEYGQTFDEITKVEDSYRNDSSLSGAKIGLAENIFEGKSLEIALDTGSWFNANVKLNNNSSEDISNAKAFVFQVKMPVEASDPMLQILLNEDQTECFRPIETEDKTAKVYVVDAETNKYTVINITPENRRNFVPSGFKGWVVINIDDYFENHWTNGGNKKLEPQKVNFIQISGMDSGKESYYFDNIGFVASQESFIEKLGATENQDAPENQNAEYGQTFDEITKVEDSYRDDSSLSGAKIGLAENIFEGNSLEVALDTGSWFNANVKLNNRNNRELSKSKAFVFQVKMPVEASNPMLQILLNEDQTECFRPIETEDKTAKVYLVDAETNKYTVINITPGNRRNFVPSGFKGWVVINIDDYFETHWTNGGNEILEPQKVNFIQISGMDSGKESYYFDNIGFVPDVQTFLNKIGATTFKYDFSTNISNAISLDNVVETEGDVQTALMFEGNGADGKQSLLFNSTKPFTAKIKMQFNNVYFEPHYIVLRLSLKKGSGNIKNISAYNSDSNKFILNKMDDISLFYSDNLQESISATVIPDGFDGWVCLPINNFVYENINTQPNVILDASKIQYISFESDQVVCCIADSILAETTDAIKEALLLINPVKPNFDNPKLLAQNYVIGQDFDGKFKNDFMDLSSSVELSLVDNVFGTGNSLAMINSPDVPWGYFTGIGLHFDRPERIKNAEAVVMRLKLAPNMSGSSLQSKFYLYEGEPNNMSSIGEVYTNADSYSEALGNATDITLINMKNRTYKEVTLSDSSSIIPSEFDGYVVIPFSYFSKKHEGYTYEDNGKLDLKYVKQICIVLTGVDTNSYSYVDDIGFLNDTDEFLDYIGAEPYTTPNVVRVQDFDGKTADKSFTDMSGTTAFEFVNEFSSGKSLRLYNKEGNETPMFMAGINLDVSDREEVKDATSIMFKIKVGQSLNEASITTSFMLFESQRENDGIGEVFQGHTSSGATVTLVNEKTKEIRKIKLDNGYDFLAEGFDGYVILPFSYFGDKNEGYTYVDNNKPDPSLAKVLMLYSTAMDFNSSYIIDDICFINNTEEYLAGLSDYRNFIKNNFTPFQDFEDCVVGDQIDALSEKQIIGAVSSTQCSIAIGDKDIDSGKYMQLFPLSNWIDMYLYSNIKDRSLIHNTEGFVVRIKTPAPTESGQICKLRFMAVEGGENLSNMGQGEVYIHDKSDKPVTVTLIDAHTLKAEEKTFKSKDFLPMGFDGWLVLPWSYFNGMNEGYPILNKKLEPNKINNIIIELAEAEPLSQYSFDTFGLVDSISEFIKNPGTAATYSDEEYYFEPEPEYDYVSVDPYKVKSDIKDKNSVDNEIKKTFVNIIVAGSAAVIVVVIVFAIILLNKKGFFIKKTSRKGGNRS